MTELRTLTNEIAVFVRDTDWDPLLVRRIRTAGTPQIAVDSVKSFRTPFGSYMILATMSITNQRPQTWRLREYVAGLLTSTGIPTQVDQVIAPGRSKSRVAA